MTGPWFRYVTKRDRIDRQLRSGLTSGFTQQAAATPTHTHRRGQQ